MKTLDRKLLRDLWSLKSQALAIALVIAGGVATYVMAAVTVEALQATRASFYHDYRFAEVFANLKRAPERLARRIAEIPGVAEVETRVVAAARLEVAGFDEPISGRLVSIPDDGAAQLNRLYLRSGRLPELGRDIEVVLSEAFAEAHELRPGDSLRAVINGRRQRLTVVGIALSPEFIYQIQPGALFPDYRRYGVLWMSRTPLATAYDMDGAFNDIALSLFPGAVEADVLERLDRLLEPYGGLGAHGRANQLSHRYLSSELEQLEQMAALFPVIFLGVAAFLLNVVISRLISLQREQIAALKAFGYANHEVGLHYLELVLAIVLLGVLLGLAGGTWLGNGMAGIYQDFFKFPYLEFRLRPGVVMSALLISSLAGLLGTLHALRLAVRLPPAEAMRPEPPARYHRSLLERLPLWHWLSRPARMILRNLRRRPLKAALSAIGVAFGCAILVLGSFQEDAIDYMMTVQFNLAQRDDLSVSLTEPTAMRAVHELAALPGVRHVEPQRSVPVRLRNAQFSELTALQGLPAEASLQRLLDTELRLIRLPPAGIVLTDYLGKVLGVGPGDLLTVEVLEGGRPIVQAPVVALVSQFVGVGAYMHIDALHRLLGEGPTLTGAALMVEPGQLAPVYSTLLERPRVAAVNVRQNVIDSFYETMGENILVFAFINTLLAGSIAFGVIYNNARIALSERSRELASLRVLGFTRGEVAYILIGEQFLLTLAGIPLGFVLGYGLCGYLAGNMDSDLYRVPLVVEPGTYAFAASIVLLAGLLSALVVGRRLGRLDLVEVLKIRE